jgi:protein ImuA
MTRSAAIQELARQLRRFEQSHRTAGAAVAKPGSAGLLEQLLPEGSLPPGSLVELLAEDEGTGVATLALLLTQPRWQAGGAVVVIEETARFYPPAAVGLGLPLERILLVRPGSPADVLWAFEQSLRCRGVAVTVGRLERLSDQAGRRLQLAAEAGGGLGLLLRPIRARGQPSWADVRLRVEPLPLGPGAARDSLQRCWQIELLRCRKGTGLGAVRVELHHDTDSVRLVSELADSAAAPWRARA